MVCCVKRLAPYSLPDIREKNSLPAVYTFRPGLNLLASINYSRTSPYDDSLLHSRTFVQSKLQRGSDAGLTHKLAFRLIYTRTFSTTTRIFMNFEVFAMIIYDHVTAVLGYVS